MLVVVYKKLPFYSDHITTSCYFNLVGDFVNAASQQQGKW